MWRLTTPHYTVTAGDPTAQQAFSVDVDIEFIGVWYIPQHPAVPHNLIDQSQYTDTMNSHTLIPVSRSLPSAFTVTSMTNAQSIPSVHLLDGTRIPWLGWGNGTGQAKTDALKAGKIAIDAGIRHIDTAQIYKTEEATEHIVSAASLPKDEIYITSKRMLFKSLPCTCSQKKIVEGKVALDQVRQILRQKARFCPRSFPHP